MKLDDRGQFLNLSGLLEGGLILIAFLVGWIFDVNPVEHLKFSWTALGWGTLAALPMFGLFVLSQRLKFNPLGRIRRFLLEALGPSLAACRWYDLVLLAALAGLAEEILFRGLLQVWIENSFDSKITGLIGSNILFGLAHFITPTYALFAGVMGLFLGFVFDATGERSLLVPITTHAVYDYLAFVMVVRSYRREYGKRDDADGTETADQDVTPL
jgi:membrane protease YdiL (CAAX protease family)